ncbi:cytochrome o ubiquinol oxidase subunit IV [Sphingomonas naphthae]|uniref:Cytochrome bo(3) ubiquinol oxidase subunit 4 n=1 Tax=Sphingomonas naphthae TaxID=1813468 RepID=A0ABY7TIZ1_9SPHN|nr:cytochrome o ubiquinol oxidase subunit IV [Sphingomonas naphthae]WCT73114.1 cytochrome o ubiquinol oxidase subunit IV [Sphingomonas naphthae]
MSAHDHAHGSHDDHHGDTPHGSMGGYMIGFGLSAILTAIPFWLVMSEVLGSASWTAVAIMAFAVVQILVHMIFFLHMSTRSEGGWTMMALIFTVVIVGITLSGSMWVMYHLNTNMMPHVMAEPGTTPEAGMHDMGSMP